MSMVMFTKHLMCITSTKSAPQCSLEDVDVGKIYNFRNNFIPVTDHSCIKDYLEVALFVRRNYKYVCVINVFVDLLESGVLLAPD